MSEYRDFGGAAESSSGRNLVAVIGIDAYEHWGALRNAVNDARGVRDAFSQLGFEVVGALFDRDATQKAIRRLVDQLEETVRPDDRVVVFFAGHGYSKPRHVGNSEHHTGYLIPIDGSIVKTQAATWINVHELLLDLSLLKALHVLVIIDACNAGRALSHVFETGRGSGPLREPFDAAHKKMSRMLIASALEDEVARDSGIEPNHSLFTSFLLEGLRVGESAIELGDGRRFMHGSDLGYFVRRRVQCHDGDLGIRQTPGYGGFHLHKNGEMPIPLPSRMSEGTMKLTMPTYELTSEPSAELNDDVIPPPPPARNRPSSSSLVELLPPAIAKPPARGARSIGLIAAIVAGALLFGIAGIVLLLPRGSAPPAPGPTRDWSVPLPAPPDAAVYLDAAVDAPIAQPPVDAAITPPKPPPPRPPAPPKSCIVTVGVFPSGAEVVLDGRVIATAVSKNTPVSLPCKKPVELTFRKRGWTTDSRTVTATEAGGHVGLRLTSVGKTP